MLYIIPVEDQRADNNRNEFGRQPAYLSHRGGICLKMADMNLPTGCENPLAKKNKLQRGTQL